MAKVLKIYSVARNNWKKSTFAVLAVAYGANSIHTEYKKNLLVRKYCQVAVKYGDISIDVLQSPRHVVVILNPAANQKNAQKEYEKYCAPLLHLAGVKTTVLTTNKDVDAIALASKIPSDAGAVLIAGGNGTVTEVITGLLRLKNDSAQNTLPVGIAPVGKTNTLAKKLYAKNIDMNDKLYRFHVMMDATFSVIYEVTNLQNVMEIRNIDETDENFNKNLKPIYAVNQVHFGVFRDADAKNEKFWYFQKLRSYAAYVYGSFDRNSPIKANLIYSLPCSGCVKCYENRNDLSKKTVSSDNKRWWQAFVPKSESTDQNAVDYAKIENPFCGVENEIQLGTVELSISPTHGSDNSALQVHMGPSSISFLNFVKQGWARVNGGEKMRANTSDEEITAQKLYLTPIDTNEKMFSIDSEEFELKKMSVTLLNNIISVFQLPSSNIGSS